jgi:Phage tail baseplate hub (GPD)
MPMNLVLLLGKTVPKPVPSRINEAMSKIEITQILGDRSGFQVSFQLNRVELSEQLDDPLIKEVLLEPFSRMILGITIDGTPEILLDGMITHHQVQYTDEGEIIFTVTGEDVSVMMDLEEKSVLHTAQAEHTIATKIISTYSRYGLIPNVKAPPTIDTPTPAERMPSQQETDLAYLRRMAERFGYVFNIRPGPTSGSNTAYWGPPRSTQPPLPALTVDMGSFTNVSSINVQLDALAATTVTGKLQDRKTNTVQSLSITKSQRTPLTDRVALTLQSSTRVSQFRGTGHAQSRGTALAQATVDRSVDRAVTLTGTLDTLVYGKILQVGRSIDVRGMGNTHDGNYIVQQVSHSIADNNYTQEFTLIRDGIGSLLSRVNI